MTVGVHPQTLVEQHLAIGTLLTTDKQDQVVLCGKLRDIWHSVGHTAADGIKALELRLRRDMTLDIVDNPVKLIE